MAGFEVAGRKFRTEADYKAALRDQKKIEEIKTKVNMEQPGEVITLYGEMQAGKYRFETAVGNDFDDEIYELANSFQKQGYTKNSRLDLSKKGRKKQRRKEAAQKKDFKKATKGKKTPDEKLDAMDDNMKQQVTVLLYKKEKRRKLLVVLCSLVALACFGYFGVYYFFADRTEMDYENLASLKGDTRFANMPAGVTIHYTEEEEVVLPVLEEYQTLYQKNKSLIGWIKIDGTKVDYPVMQTANNEYYLDHNYNQEYDKNGSIFLDAECDVVHRSTNLIVYGHHMKSGKMFGDLSKYSSEDFYKNHPTIQFDTIYEKGTYQIMYVFRSRIYNEDEIVFKYYQFIDAVSDKEFASNMQEMAALSLYDTGVTASYGDELLTLSTCDYSEEDGRFVVVAKKIE